MSPKVSFAANQCRAARALLGWSQERLARESRVATRTIAGFEIGEGVPLDRTLSDICRALETGGVEFTNGKRPRARLSNHAKFLAELTAVAESAKSPLDLTLKIDELFSKHVERINAFRLGPVQSLCASCHGRKALDYQPPSPRHSNAIGADGLPLDPAHPFNR